MGRSTITVSADSPVVEFTDVILADGSVVSLGPDIPFLGTGPQVRWGNAIARLGTCLDRDQMTWQAQYGERFFVSAGASEFVGDVACLSDDAALALVEQGDAGSGNRHAIPWAEITRVGIVAAPTGSPGRA